MKKVELLAPAGNFEKLEMAVHYGADAVYLGGKQFSLRNFSGNFTMDQLKAAVIFAHERRVKVYVACNIYPRNHEQDAFIAYLECMGNIGPDALIVSDPGMFQTIRRILPEMPIHMSTQANVTNTGTARFWESLGAGRINAARELSLTEIGEMARQCAIEVEVFVHGAMCIAYSGRCLLSSFMTKRESNRGMCCQPCRWQYAVVEETRPGQYFPIAQDETGTFIFNSRDLCMIDHIPELIESGISALKIEGRMKGIHYVASAVKTYREAIDAYYDNPREYTVRPCWIDALRPIGDRGYCTGFYFGDPDQVLPNLSGRHYAGGMTIVGKVLDRSEQNSVLVDVRNKVYQGEEIDVMTRKGPTQKDRILGITTQAGVSLAYAQPGSVVRMTLTAVRTKNDLLKQRKQDRDGRRYSSAG